MFDLITLSAKVPDLGTMENLKEYAANVTLSGLIIVFAMLILLVFIISVFGAIMDKINGKNKPKAPKAEKKTPESAQSTAATTNVSQDTEDEGVVAAISAAIMMMYEGTGKRPVIRSIKPAAGTHSAWKQAGILNNVRSF